MEFISNLFAAVLEFFRHFYAWFWWAALLLPVPFAMWDGYESADSIWFVFQDDDEPTDAVTAIFAGLFSLIVSILGAPSWFAIIPAVALAVVLGYVLHHILGDVGDLLEERQDRLWQKRHAARVHGRE